MAIVKQVSFKDSETEVYLYANNHGNFSEYIKNLIKRDMGEVNGFVNHISDIGKMMRLEQESSTPNTDNFNLKAERDDLEV